MKKLKHSLLFVSLSLLVTFTASASGNTCPTESVQSLSQIAQKYNVNISDIKAACTNIKNLSCVGSNVVISGNCNEILNQVFGKPNCDTQNPNNNTDSDSNNNQNDSELNTNPEQKPEQKPETDGNSKPETGEDLGTNSKPNSGNNGSDNNLGNENIGNNDSNSENQGSVESGSQVSEFEQEVIRLVNEIRVENGLSVLTENRELSRVARAKSEDMYINNYFSHTSPTYGSPFDMMKNFGISYTAAAENIAKGQLTPSQVVNSWMNSSGHRANILNASFTQIGVGYCENGNIWTQMFIK